MYNYKKDKISLNTILLNDKKVNNYTRMMIFLYMMDYYEDYYIPNRKLMNKLNINKKRTIVALHQLEDNNVIKVFYKGRKRYFTFIANIKKESNIYIDDYNWLEEE